jgi:hypothetical protein
MNLPHDDERNAIEASRLNELLDALSGYNAIALLLCFAAGRYRNIN